MDPHRWQQVKDTFQAAVGLERIRVELARLGIVFDDEHERQA